MGKLLGVVIVGLGWVSPAAANITGNQIYGICTSEPLACASYFTGLIEGVKWGATMVTVASGAATETADVNLFTDIIIQYCLPDGADNRQMIDVAVKFLNDNPSQRHESARTLATLAWREAFPC